MDKKFMPVHTPTFRAMVEVIEASLGKASYANHHPSEVLIYNVDTCAGPISVMISRAIDYNYIALETDVKITIDHEVVLDTTIKSDHEIVRIMQIIKCLNPARLTSPVGVVASGITACDEDDLLFDFEDDLLI